MHVAGLRQQRQLRQLVLLRCMLAPLSRQQRTRSLAVTAQHQLQVAVHQHWVQHAQQLRLRGMKCVVREG